MLPCGRCDARCRPVWLAAGVRLRELRAVPLPHVLVAGGGAGLVEAAREDQAVARDVVGEAGRLARWQGGVGQLCPRCTVPCPQIVHRRALVATASDEDDAAQTTVERCGRVHPRAEW